MVDVCLLTNVHVRVLLPLLVFVFQDAAIVRSAKVVTLLLKIERPNEQLKGIIYWVRTRGDAGLYCQLLKDFTKAQMSK